MKFSGRHPGNGLLANAKGIKRCVNILQYIVQHELFCLNLVVFLYEKLKCFQLTFPDVYIRRWFIFLKFILLYHSQNALEINSISRFFILSMHIPFILEL